MSESAPPNKALQPAGACASYLGSPPRGSSPDRWADDEETRVGDDMGTEGHAHGFGGAALPGTAR